jgi:multicomponent Na+:H+ antiporter subunit D
VTWALPLPAVIPLLAAAVAAAGDHVLPRRLGDAIGVLGAAAAFAFSLLVLLESERHLQLEWFGGWRPRGHAAIGIAFVADPLGAGMATLASGLVLASLLYSWSFLRHAARPYDVLMLVFGGAMSGFSLTGDLFNMFVWFELMGVAAYALAGFEISELGPLQGAVNFAVTNTVGAYLILMGIALLYARTGALNLAQIGHTLAGHRPGGLVIVALTLLVCGFLVKAAVVPFHLWLADAHAVAPAPVCVLFSGAMVALGLLGVTRCYWTVFDAAFGVHHAHDIRGVLVALGIATALLGALMAFLQRHLKRLLAYSTISHMGIVLVGIALLDEKALGGAADIVLSHGLLKGSLFCCSGILLLRFEDVDELRLHGKGRELPLVGVMFGLGALALTGLPYVGSYLGHAQIDEGATLDHIGWLQPLLMLAAGVSSAAILRAGARVFLGWGPRDDPLLSPEPPESSPERSAAMPALLAVTAALLALGLAASVVPGLGQRVEHGAGVARDRGAYVDRVLRGVEAPGRARLPFVVEPTGAASLLYGAGGTVIALALAALGLFRRRLPQQVRAPARAALGPPVALAKAVHSGVIGDYVMWITVGTALVGGVWALLLR